MDPRIKNILLKLESEGLDGLLVSLPANISYLTRFQSRDSYLLLSKKKNLYFTDSRYTGESKLKLKGQADLVKTNGSVFKLIADSCLGLGLKNIAFEERHLPFAEYKEINKNLGKRTELTATHSLIEGLRNIKEAVEIELISKAIDITARALDFAKNILRPGKKEIEIVGELERYIRYEGAYSSAFDIIVASGENSSFPHHLSSNRKLNQNEIVLLDIGVDYLGYKSDLTRVFFLGRITPLARKIYNIVLEAQKRAIAKIKPHQAIGNIDKAARQYIHMQKYGKYFCHNLGHGIGLEIHENPQISANSKESLQANMVFTVEPAVYLPNKFGIRLEDIVLITKKGNEVLSGFIHK